VTKRQLLIVRDVWRLTRRTSLPAEVAPQNFGN
jgi:hypothetical protein